MRNTPPDYLASRLGIVTNNQRNVPYGWELPEDDQHLEQPRPERSFFKVALISIGALLTCLMFNAFGHVSTF
jgi:hypothetical protein